MASPTQQTWVWVNSGSWWWTGRPGVLKSMGLQRVGHDWATELNWTSGLRYDCINMHHGILILIYSNMCGAGKWYFHGWNCPTSLLQISAIIFLLAVILPRAILLHCIESVLCLRSHTLRTGIHTAFLPFVSWCTGCCRQPWTGSQKTPQPK